MALHVAAAIEHNASLCVPGVTSLRSWIHHDGDKERVHLDGQITNERNEALSCEHTLQSKSRREHTFMELWKAKVARSQRE